MSKYLAPLGIFVGGQVFLLFMWLLLPSIGSAGTTLAGNAHVSTFWGMSWAANSLRLIVIIAGEFITIIAALIAFLKAKA